MEWYNIEEHPKEIWAHRHSHLYYFRKGAGYYHKPEYYWREWDAMAMLRRHLDTESIDYNPLLGHYDE